MGIYDEAYKNYYSGIRQKVSPKTNIYRTASAEELLSRRGRKDGFSMVNLIIKQLIGTIVLFILAFTIKFIPTQEAKDIYVFSKSVVKEDFDYKSFDYKNFMEYVKNINVIELINKIDLSI